MNYFVNKVILVGRVGKVKSNAHGLRLSVATNSYTPTGEQKTTWHHVVMADVPPVVSVGQEVYIEGKLKTRSWKTEGKKHYITEVVAHRCDVLSTPLGN